MFDPHLVAARWYLECLDPESLPEFARNALEEGHDGRNLAQIAALPLGSHLRIDAWDDEVHFLNVKAEPILNAREKMPLELTPIYFRLSRYSSGSHAALSPAENVNATPQYPSRRQ